MIENLLMDIENRRQAKMWRNISIILVCLVLMLVLKSFSKNNDAENKVLGDSIAEIDITGVIARDDYRDEKINGLIDDKKIKAVILNIDSPGGTVTPSEILYDLISKLNAQKPVVVLMGGMATSGAYMASLGADYIIARNTTLTGSIGVLMQSYEIVELAKKLGVELKTFKSSELKGMPSLFEPNNKASNDALQSGINDIYDYFAGLVKERRKKMTEANFKLATNGQAFTGRQALQIGLVDEIGDKNSALKYLESKNINTKLPIIKVDLRKKTKASILEKLTSRFFFNFKEISPTSVENSNLMSIYNQL